VYKPDFVSFYTAAKLMWTDRSSLYDLEQQRLIQQPIDPSRGKWVLPYIYPPFFAVILLPLAWLPFSLAFIAVTLVNLALLITSVKILIQKLQLNPQQSSCLILATFCNYGVHYALLEAQTSFIALTLLVLFVTALNSPATGKAGIWSGLLFFKPQLALIPLIVLIGRKKWIAVGLAIGVVGFLGLVSLFTIGLDGLEQYITVSRRVTSGEDYFHIMRPEQPERMHNLRALTYFFFPAPWKDYIWWISTVAGIALVTLISRARDGVDGISLRQWTIILAGLILVTPHLHDHDLTLLIIPSAFFLKWAGDIVPPAAAPTLVGLGMLSLINTMAYPHLPPLVPIALLSFLIVEQWRGARTIF
jgi:glycosyl transferase family 87